MEFLMNVIGRMGAAIVFIFGAIAIVFVLLLMGVGIVMLIGLENFNPIVALIIMVLPLGVVTTWAIIATINERRW